LGGVEHSDADNYGFGIFEWKARYWFANGIDSGVRVLLSIVQTNLQDSGINLKRKRDKAGAF